MMKKEFYSLLLAVNNFRDYLKASPMTYILIDSQPVCWALCHCEDHLKLARWIIKLFSYQIYFVVTHGTGDENWVADFLSRLYFMTDTKEKDPLDPKDIQHIISPFSPYKVLSKEDVIAGFSAGVVTPCDDPSFAT
jgi:hypothetical protein